MAPASDFDCGPDSYSCSVVAHWGVLMELTGRDFKNCEVFRTSSKEFKSRRISAF